MIQRFIYTLLLLVVVTLIKAQQSYIDSLRHEIKIVQNDTAKVFLFRIITEEYAEIKPDSSLYFAEQLLTVARKLNFKLNEADALQWMGYAFLNMVNYPRALQTLLSALAIVEDPESEQNILPDKYLDPKEFLKRPVTAHVLRLGVLASTNHNLGILYGNTYNHEKELFHYLQALQFAEQTGHVQTLCSIHNSLGQLYLSRKKPDSALMYEQKAYDLSMQTGYKKDLGSILLNLGRIESDIGNLQLAREYFKRAIDVSIKQNYLRGVVAANLRLAGLYRQSEKRDSNLHYANAALDVAKYLNSPDLLLRSYTALAAFYRSTNNNDSTVKYQGLIIKINDSLFNLKQVQEFQNVDLNEQQRQQEIESAKKDYHNRLQVYLLLAGLATFLMVAIFLWRISHHRKKSNVILQVQKKELESALYDLKATQTQLIQREKMASLGELTAGIAHEIQNPLNFVNNFSEVNKEMLVELNEEIDKGNYRDAKAIAQDVIANEEKINHHGKRADAIVKGMLQHSRSSTGQKESTDINALADEYLRLSFQGLRAKDKSFNATLETNFDDSIGKINIIPQDIGRVLLNLYNNAFYALAEKNASTSSARQQYAPTITVTTKRLNDKVEIKVKDNGNGISQKVIDKIFQPFFTTKPTGQGTGLGLSLSYDILKAHGGEIKVETKENEWTEFIMQLK